MKLKGIDGGPHKRRNMWFNSMIREEPYPGLKVSDGAGNGPSSDGAKLGAAWLSSARAVRCRLKCHNERNPCRQLQTGKAVHSGGTAAARCEEGGDDVKSARPLRPGRHTCYNGGDSGKPRGDAEHSMKPDSLVIAHQPWRGEYVPGPCTHRPSSHGSLWRLKSATARGGLGRNR